ADSGTFLVSLSVAKEIHYVVIRNRALGACTYLALLYAWTNAVISTVIYKNNIALCYASEVSYETLAMYSLWADI
ncbi:MAG: hypothetical protein RR576_09580, partial [Oscillospiraceae bacterium]